MHPFSFLLQLPGSIVRVSLDLFYNSPKIFMTSGLLLAALTMLPIRNPHANLDRIHELQSWIAFLGAVEVHLVSTYWPAIGRKVRSLVG